MGWIAEDVPWYQIDQAAERPWRDEDLGMSAARRLGEFAAEDDARQAVARVLGEASRYSFIKAGGEAAKYMTAAQAIVLGVDGIRIHGRYYRVREI